MLDTMYPRWRRTRTLLAATALLLGTLGCEPSTGPIVPILPPLTISSPDLNGEVSIMGDAEPRALVFAFNEVRETGVIGAADDAGRYQLLLGADVGDDISVWQRVGTEDSPPRIGTVPGP